MLKPHAHRADIHSQAEQVRAARSLDDEPIRLLARGGFAIDAGVLAREVRRAGAFDASIEQAALAAYRAPRTAHAAGAARTGGGTRRPGSRVRPMAVAPGVDGGAHHRLQALPAAQAAWRACGGCCRWCRCLNCERSGRISDPLAADRWSHGPPTGQKEYAGQVAGKATNWREPS